MVTGAPTNDYLRNVRFTVAVYITLEVCRAIPVDIDQLLQPVLQTLTSSFSDDTVYALAIMASLLHVMTLDFDVISRHDDYIRDVDAMPINCLLLASVLIASRFGNPKKASTFLQCHVIAFSLLALAQIWLVDTKNRSLTYGFTLLVVLATSLYIFTLQFSWLVVYSLGIVLLTFVMPLFYVYAQRYKRNVSGPWNPDQIPTRPKSKSTSAGSRSAATTPLSSEGNSPRCKATELVTDTPENLWTHNVTINVPSAQVCKILTLVLKSEPCINPKECTISFSAQENILKVEIVASNQRALRLQTNGFYESCYTIMSTLETFHPDMQQT
ncbi:bifunctional Phosphatidylinositol N-acetylglucosaminyltransferase subunit C/CTAG-Pcc1 family [Babesia duncani]|uniref:Bifunctional Phosphatidylinositol N-acetylglucosaminyltransferase subunit C/CTAG-Pcc1 family n=1 Tax=Babesia duncani TaxID=323732 RepID=A0AAD9PN27_9APIC|nr:bifunctional Phosphatidylinositol N-acetylglucosaminyltransferase subunit C/CTAG-Pcc1 family [Babesia duncani]